MASDEGNSPRDPADQADALRACEKCGAVMKQLGAFPALSFHAAVRIFRCYVCDHVVSEQV